MTSQINATIRAVVEGAFADVAWREEMGCAPLLEADVGELSSSAALEVAKCRRVDVRGVGEAFLTRLREAIPGAWRLTNGYLVLTDAPLQVVVDEARAWRADRAQARRGVGVAIGVADDVRLPLYVRMRLAGLAALQGWISATYAGGGSFRVSCSDGVGVSRGMGHELRAAVMQQYRGWMVAALEGAPQSQAGSLWLGSPGEAAQPGGEFVWMARDTYERLTPTEREAVRHLREVHNGQIKIPGDGWLVTRERTLAEVLSPQALAGVVRQLSSEDAVLRWLFHAASATPSSDFDPYVAIVDESSSLLWNLRALVHRFRVLVPDPESIVAACGSARQVEPSEGDGSWMARERFPWRRLVMHGEWMTYWLERAVYQADVESLVVVLEQFGRWAHRFLNAPQTRAGLQSKENNSFGSEIIASLQNGVSSILPAVEV